MHSRTAHTVLKAHSNRKVEKSLLVLVGPCKHSQVVRAVSVLWGRPQDKLCPHWHSRETLTGTAATDRADNPCKLQGENPHHPYQSV